VTISGSGSSSILITFAKAVTVADRVTITIGNNQVNYTRRLDILPGDVNDDSVVNTADGVFILNNATPAHAYNAFDDMNGDGSVNTADFILYRPKIGTGLPILPAQLAAAGVGPGGGAPLTPAEVTPVLTEAIAQWAAAGLPAQDVARLRGVTVEITDLPAGYLGGTLIGSNTIELSASADGYGWFTGSGASTSSAFARSGAAAGHEDLLTVVMHELGHTLGLNDLDPSRSPNDLMAETLATGARRLPNAHDVAMVEATQAMVAHAAGPVAPISAAEVDALFLAADLGNSPVLPASGLASEKASPKSENDKLEGMRTRGTRVVVAYQSEGPTVGARRPVVASLRTSTEEKAPE
jgi:hypothetical protein